MRLGFILNKPFRYCVCILDDIQQNRNLLYGIVCHDYVIIL